MAGRRQKNTMSLKEAMYRKHRKAAAEARAQGNNITAGQHEAHAGGWLRFGTSSRA